MGYDDLPGDERIKGYLSRLVEKGMVGHSFLFGGPAGAGKKAFARRFAEEVIAQGDEAQRLKLRSGNHPDLHFLRPEGKAALHSIETLRAFCEEVYLPPNEASRKVFIIEEADRMAPTSANALLKTFEEPSSDTVIILVSDRPAALLPTILSRCRTLYFQGPGKEQAGHSLLLDLLAAGSVRRFGDLQSTLRGLEEEVDNRIEESLGEQRKSLKERELTAIHRAAIEKEIEGAATHQLQAEATRLLTTLLHWYRDRHLSLMEVDDRFLIHQDRKEELVSLGRERLPALSDVEKAVKESLLAVQRSTPLSMALESLFLRLGY